MTGEMRILTVRQPWAWAIIHGGKDVENRGRSLGGYTGPVAIHVGKTDDVNAFVHASRRPRRALNEAADRTGSSSYWGNHGFIIGVVDLTETHEPLCETDEHPACSPWAEPDAFHLVLARPRPLAHPIRFKGALGLRRLDQPTIDLIQKELA